MALSRIWYSSTGVLFPDVTTVNRTYQSFLWLLQAMLRGQVVGSSGGNGPPPASAYWTLVGSCDGVTAGMDSTDRLGPTFDAAKMVPNAPAAARTAWVLRSPSSMPDGPLYFSMDYAWNTTNEFTRARFFLSRSAPTFVGTTLTPPASATHWTSSAAPTLSAAGGIFLQDAPAIGAAHRAHLSIDGQGHFWWAVSRVSNATAPFRTVVGVQHFAARPGDLAPFGLFFKTSSSASFNALNAANNATWGLGGSGVEAPMRGWPTSGVGARGLDMMTYQLDSASSLDAVTTGNTADGFWDELPLLVTNTNAAEFGVRGPLPDVGLVGKITPGSVFPAAPADPERVAVGSVLIPFDLALVL